MLIHFLVDGHLGSFQVLAITNNASKNQQTNLYMDICMYFSWVTTWEWNC